MRIVGAYEAKTHLSQLLTDVENGEIIAITKHGRTVALLTPAGEQDPVLAAITAIRHNRHGVTLGKDLDIKSMISEGRK